MSNLNKLNILIPSSAQTYRQPKTISSQILFCE